MNKVHIRIEPADVDKHINFVNETQENKKIKEQLTGMT